jgi:hypothetical protein
VGASLELEVFSSRFSRDRVTSGDTVFDVQICRYADVPHDLITNVALGYTPGQCRHGGDVSAVCFLLKDDRIAHTEMAFDFDNTSDYAGLAIMERSAGVTGAYQDHSPLAIHFEQRQRVIRSC